MRFKNVFKSRLQEIKNQSNVVQSNKANSEQKKMAIDDIELVSLKLLELLEIETIGSDDIAKELKKILTILTNIDSNMSVKELFEAVDDARISVEILIKEVDE